MHLEDDLDYPSFLAPSDDACVTMGADLCCASHLDDAPHMFTGGVFQFPAAAAFTDEEWLLQHSGATPIAMSSAAYCADPPTSADSSSSSHSPPLSLPAFDGYFAPYPPSPPGSSSYSSPVHGQSSSCPQHQLYPPPPPAAYEEDLLQQQQQQQPPFQQQQQQQQQFFSDPFGLAPDLPFFTLATPKVESDHTSKAASPTIVQGN